MMRTRQDVLAGASAWGGVRVGEQTGDVGTTALEFSLSGIQLDPALAAIQGLGATVTSTEIDVEPDQVRRPAATPDAASAEEGADDVPEGPDDLRLRVEVAEASSIGAGPLFRSVMAVFSVVGVVATIRAVADRLGGRRDRRSGPPRREIDRVDLRDDPPTQETPRVPPQW